MIRLNSFDRVSFLSISHYCKFFFFFLNVSECVCWNWSIDDGALQLADAGILENVVEKNDAGDA